MKKILLSGLTAFLVFTFISCNQSDIGIFYGIEKEEKIVDNSLSNSITVGAMAELSGQLYIAAGKVYKKTKGSSEEWDKCSSPSGYDLTTSLTAFSGSIYAVWFNKDSADSALYSSVDGNNWTEVSDPDFSGDFSLVKSANAVMVVSTVTGTNTGEFYTTTTGLDNSYGVMSDAISDINALGGHFDIDHDGTNYWFLTKENVYETADLTAALPAASLDKLDDDEYFRYIYCKDTSHVYVSSSYGKLSFYDGSWDEEIEDLSLNINDMIVFTIDSTDNFFVGTYSYGYYEPDTPGCESSNIDDLDNPDSDSISCDYQTYNSSDLKTSAVLGFFADTDNDELYALTYGQGLWKNVDDDGDRTWQRE